MPDQLSAIEHVVVLMLENRSFDHMLGFLYADEGNVSPGGQPFEGLTGDEHNPAADGTAIPIRRLAATDPDVYLTPGADPGEGFTATNDQLYGSARPAAGATPTNNGFVTNFATSIAMERTEHWGIVAGTVAADIMSAFTPALLPVLSGLARGFAVCDHWYASVPTETMPNRAFVCAGTSVGRMDDKSKVFDVPTIFGALDGYGVTWSVYGYSSQPLTRLDFPDTTAAADSHFGLFGDFQAAAAAGTLAAYSFLEPSWESTGNSQHPNYNVALGEQLIHDVYRALRDGPAWAQTLLIVTYDEHGGCYDHIPPPSGATPPDDTAGENGFDFRRFGVRVPTVLVSPLIPAGSVFRAPVQGAPLDHTSILRTLERRFEPPSLTGRDAAAPDVGAALSLAVARTDDPLAGISPPTSTELPPAAEVPSHLQRVHADLVAQLPVADEAQLAARALPVLRTTAELTDYIDRRTAAWIAQRQR